MLTSDLLAGLAGIVLSLCASYFPGFAPWFKALAPDTKRLIMLGALVVVSAGVFGLSCAAIVDAVACSRDGALVVLRAFVVAMVTNQSAYAVSPGVIHAANVVDKPVG